MKNELIKIGNKSKKAFSFGLNSKKKNKVLKDYCNLIKKNKKIIIYQNKKDVYPKTCINDLINQINHFFDKKISIEIEYEENLISPSVKEEKKEQDEVDEAFNSADTDKNINNIKEHFDAEIDKNSIKKIKGR